MAAKKDLKNGMPSEIANTAVSLLDKLHELYGETGVHLSENVNAAFIATDDQHQTHTLLITFDPGRGSGEYVLVPE